MNRGVFVSNAEAEQTTLEGLLKRYELDVLPAMKSQAVVRSRIAVVPVGSAAFHAPEFGCNGTQQTPRRCRPD